MRTLLASAILLATMTVGTVPASAQRIELGPDGPRIDLRSRSERARDLRRERRDREYDRRFYREQRYRDGRRDYDRRGSGY